MTWQEVGLFVGPLLTYLGIRFTGRQADRATAVSAGASAAATEVERKRLGLTTLETSLAEQERRIKRLNDDLNVERTARQKAETRVGVLETAMRDAGIAVPAA